MIFNKKFARSKTSLDADVIILQDIKNLVLFLSSENQFSNQFIEFFHRETCDQFLNDLIIYFEYFIKIVEYLLIRRDEMSGSDGMCKIHNFNSVNVDRMLSEYLSQYRLILAREYSKIIIGVDDTYPFHHLHNKQKKSLMNKDRLFFETLISYATRIVWIALHRRAFTVIDCEINRLFRSSHFNMAEKQIKNGLKFSKREQEIVYGINNNIVNCRNQKSPLTLEILNVSPKNVQVLAIGVNKYRGNDPRMKALEHEYVIPDAQLSFIDVQHGILGHPKSLYNTMLQLNWNAVRDHKFNKNYDPYRLIRSPYLSIPDVRETHKMYKEENSLLKFNYEKKIDRLMVDAAKKTWNSKEKILKHEMDVFGRAMDVRRSRRMSSVMTNAMTLIDFERKFDEKTQHSK